MLNPFSSGNPVRPDLFVGRREEISQIVSRIKAYGQSTLISGDLCVGKSSLLLYLMDKKVQEQFFGDEKEKYVFSFIDAQTLDDELKPFQFWGNLFQSVEEFKQNETISGLIDEMVETTNKDPFSSSRYVRNLIKKIGDEGIRLVLIIDELDSFLVHQHFSKAGFLGNLRSLATNSNGALAIVAASCFSLFQLDKMTRGDSNVGSPFFNYMRQVTVGAFSEEREDLLLQGAKEKFNQDAINFIKDLAGGHPLLLQAIAFELWHEFDKEEPARKDPVVLGNDIKQLAKAKTSLFMDGNWRKWTHYKKRTFVYVAALQTLSIGSQGDSDQIKCRDELTKLQPEVRELEMQGYIREDIDSGTYIIPSQIILEWVIEKSNDYR